MLGLAELVASGRHQMSHAIVFLFNGAEESNWLAAHGFIVNSYPISYETPSGEAEEFTNWADSVKAVSLPVEHHTRTICETACR